MKNIFLSLVFILISLFAFANNDNSGKIFKGTITINEIVNNQVNKIVLTFDDLKSFNEFDGQQMYNMNDCDECTVSVELEVKTTVTDSVGKVNESSTITALDIPCKEASKKYKN